MTFFTYNNITILNSDPTNKYHEIINNSITKSLNLFSDMKIKHLKIIKPGAPILQGFPKVHKDDVPIGTLVNFRFAPTYMLSKKLDVS